jgi:hypothetical protein
MWRPMKDPNSNETVLATTTEMAVHKPIQCWSAARKRDVSGGQVRRDSVSDQFLIRWLMHKHKHLAGQKTRAAEMLGRLAKGQPVVGRKMGAG